MRRFNIVACRAVGSGGGCLVLSLPLRAVANCSAGGGVFSRTHILRLDSKYLDAAMRLTTPSPAGPATAAPDGSRLAPDDPMVEWREHYSAEHSMPYYHNLVTNETSWEIPSGFRTRFPSHHKSLGNRVDAVGTVWPKDGQKPKISEAVAECKPTGIPGDAEARAATQQAASTTAATSDATAASGETGALNAPAGGDATEGKKTTAGPLGLKARVAAFGGAGFLLYLIVHNTSLFIVFTMMYVFGFDLVALAKSYGIAIPSSLGAGGGLFANFLVAVALNKTLVPVQLVITIALAPRFAPMLQPAASKIAGIGSAFFSRP